MLLFVFFLQILPTAKPQWMSSKPNQCLAPKGLFTPDTVPYGAALRRGAKQPLLYSKFGLALSAPI